jgi:hypothetical protein
VQIERQAYHSIERQCERQLSELAAIRASNLATASNVEFHQLYVMISRLELAIADIRARAIVETEKELGPALDKRELTRRLAAADDQLRKATDDGGLLKSATETRALAEEAERSSNESDRVCDAAREAQD